MGECQEVADERCRANEHDTYEHVIELGLQYYKQSCGQVHPNKETVELAYAYLVEVVLADEMYRADDRNNR
jgi:hypothetical protein